MRTAAGARVLAVALLLASPLAAQDSVEDRVGPSVVRIVNDESSGSGMFLDGDGLILTNAHVACSPLPFQVRATVKAGGKSKEQIFSKVALLGFHPDYDLALLRIDLGGTDATVKPVALGTAAPAPGDRVWAIGFPGDYERGNQKVATWGKVRSPNKDFYGLSYLQVDVSVNHGNSGGPLTNDKGEVIGIVTAMSPDGQTIAVPIPAVKPERFGALKDRNPNREVSTLLLKMAETLLQTSGPSNQVMHLYRSALIWDSGNAALYAKVGQLNLVGRRYPAAIAYFTRSLQMQPWPEKPDVYRSLGIALIGLRKIADALTIFQEGLDKYPLDNAQLWGDIAGILEQQKRPIEAAFSARVALKTWSGRAEEMNELYRRMHDSLSAADLVRLRALEGDVDRELGRLRAAADQARRDGKPFMGAEAERVITSMAGVQQESLSPGLDRIEVGKPSSVKMSDEEVEIRFIRGRIEVAKEHVRSGRTPQAIEILEDLIKTYPRNPETDAARLALKIFKRN